MHFALDWTWQLGAGRGGTSLVPEEGSCAWQGERAPGKKTMGLRVLEEQLFGTAQGCFVPGGENKPVQQPPAQPGKGSVIWRRTYLLSHLQTRWSSRRCLHPTQRTRRLAGRVGEARVAGLVGTERRRSIRINDWTHDQPDALLYNPQLSEMASCWRGRGLPPGLCSCCVPRSSACASPAASAAGKRGLPGASKFPIGLYTPCLTSGLGVEHAPYSSCHGWVWSVFPISHIMAGYGVCSLYLALWLGVEYIPYISHHGWAWGIHPVS